jgi:hypothetical protein
VIDPIPPMTLVEIPAVCAKATLSSFSNLLPSLNDVVANDAVEAVPVKLPTKVTVVRPLIDVMIPVVPLIITPVFPTPIVVIPDTNTLPFTVNLELGIVVPIPILPLEGIYENAVEPVVAIPIELTPELDANVGNSVCAVSV